MFRFTLTPVLALLLWTTVPGSAWSGTAEVLTSIPDCAVCGKPVVGDAWKYGEQFICDDCHNLPTKCSVCGLPVREGYLTTSDGRQICKTDAPNVILKIDDARELFEETRQELLRMTRGELQLRFPEITVNLFDVDYWNDQKGDSREEGLHKAGFSQSRKIGENYVHNVLLLSGQTRAVTTSVCAHEYMHLWINENVGRSRNLEGDTVEALCELLAHELMGERRLAAEQERIRTNPYTNGRILTAIQWKDRFGFTSILDWVRNGKGAVLEGVEVARAREETILASMRAVPRHTPAAAPTTMILKGLSGTAERRFALVNNRTLTRGERGAVRVGDGKVRVRCLEIREKEVVLEVEGRDQPVTLRLGDENGLSIAPR